MDQPKPSLLTEEQRKRIEENRKKALEKKKSKEISLGLKIPNGLQNTESTLHTSNVNNKSESLHPTSFYKSHNSTAPVSTGNLPKPNSIEASAPSSSLQPTSFYKSHNSTAPVSTGNLPKPNSLEASAPSSFSNASVKPSIITVNAKSPPNNHNKIDVGTFFGATEKRLHASFSLISRKRFKVFVPYNVQVLDTFKTISSRTYEMKDKSWNFAIEDHDKLVKALTEISATVSFTPLPLGVLKIFQNAPKEHKIKETDISMLDAKLKESLLPFQKTGVYFGINHGGRILIADDMGLGKTIESIAIASYYIKEWPLLVVCPSSVRYSWLEAFHTWLPSLRKSDINMINNMKSSVDFGKVIIMSYDILGRKKAEIEAKKFQVIIFDESHFLKNYKAARTKAAQNACRNAKRVLLLSGTPALSRPSELYTQICMVKPYLFGNLNDFGIRYCAGKTTTFGWDFSGSSNMTELNLILQETIMIRRLKSEVLTQLPPKRRQVVMLDPSKVKFNKKQFKAYSKEMANVDLKGMEKRGVLLQYFNDTAAAKIDAVCDYVNDILEADHKFLCFAHHKIVLDEIGRMLSLNNVGFMRIDGTTPAETRKLNCDRFQLVDSCKVALLSITAANAGLNLSSASLVIFAELFWNPGILTQAEDRAHRIGQQDSLIVQYLVAEGTSDDYIWPMVQEKLETLSKVGLSKDNFKDSDTVTLQREDTKMAGQTTLEDYFMNNDEVDSFLNDVKFEDFCDSMEPAEKKLHLST